MNISLVSFLEIPHRLQMETRHWRNSESVAKYFRIPHITEEQHKNWLEKLKEEQPGTIAFVIEKDSDYIGVTYFHSISYERKTADWGIYIHRSDMRGQGIGKAVLARCLQYAKETLKMEVVSLDVRAENLRAISVYEQLGFERVISNEPHFYRYAKKLTEE